MGRKTRILIAEDSPTQAIKLASLLDQNGYSIEIAENGLLALEKLKGKSADLVISDIMMPEMNGYELCSAIRKDPKLNQIPVILLTSLTETEDVIRGLEHQADYYVTKPYNGDFLISKVNAITSGQDRVELRGKKLLVSMRGRKHQVSSDRRQMLNLLLSTYENAIIQNRELSHIRDKLEEANVNLTESLTALEASEIRFRSLVQTIPDIVYRLDPEGFFTFVNDAISCLGFTPEDLIGKHFSYILEPAEAKAISREEILPLLRGQKTGGMGAPKLFDERRTGDRKTTGLEVKLHFKHSQGTKSGLLEPLTDDILFAEVISAGLHQNEPETKNTFFIGTVGVIRDITFRKKMERDLEQANADLERKVEERTARLHSTNQALKSEIAEREKIEKDLQESLGQIKNAQAQAKTMESQLRQAQKMEALGTLAGGMAHEFNNLLSVMMGYAEIVLEDARENGRNIDELQEIVRSAQSAKKLIKQVLTFSRRMEPDFKTLDINQELERTVNLLRATLPKMIQVNLSLTEGLPLINADSNQVQQMIMNLVTNARDAMPGGGEITLATCLEEVFDQICIVCSQNFSGKFFVISVMDNGTGMDNEVIERIFEPFYTTKEVGQGTGLGLSTVFGIVSAHEGHITCSSAPGYGSAFKVYLPCTNTGPSTGPDKKQDVEDEEKGDGNILLVDDEEHILNISATHLIRAGYKVIKATSGEQALNLYDSKDRDVDLVVLDLNMPGMGGIKCLEKLLSLDPKAKVIICSGYSRDGDIPDFLFAKTEGVLLKPFIKDELLQKVGAVMSRPTK